MPGRPQENVSKGSVHKKLDDLLNHRDRDGKFDRREPFLHALRALNPQEDRTEEYLQILKDQARVSNDEAEYLREYWYTANPEVFWPYHLPTEPIVRRGTIKALEEAISRNVYFDSLWMSAGNDFKVIVTATPQQVTRIILTPEVSYGAHVPILHRNRAPIWIIKRAPGPVTTIDLGP